MKWPSRLVIIRHAQSAYNILRDKKNADPTYVEFKKAFDEGNIARASALVGYVREKYSLGVSDYDTPITEAGRDAARQLGNWFSIETKPDVIFVSPYLRTRQTLEAFREMCPWVHDVPVISDDRIREQEHGLSLIYNDWRVFFLMHPEQQALRNLQGPYWYQYPQGESVSQVRDRVRSFMSTLIREYAGARVMIFTHHLTILSIRSLLERLTPEQFIDLDNNDKPKNLGVTVYKGEEYAGRNGKLMLLRYNARD